MRRPLARSGAHLFRVHPENFSSSLYASSATLQLPVALPQLVTANGRPSARLSAILTNIHLQRRNAVIRMTAVLQWPALFADNGEYPPIFLIDGTLI